jgi:quinoprotein glucose dehydrogenase
VPTGNGIPDFVSGKRPSYTNSIVALDLDSGAPEWSFQTVHADRWNSDLVAQPALVSLPSPKGPIPALVQGTKAGQVFVVDRRDGKKVVDIAEARVPAGAGSATQPVSKLSVGPKRLEEADMWGLTPFDQLVCRIRFRQARYDGPFTPPGETASIAFPGHDGVIGWGGVAVDQVNKLVVAQTSAVPSYVDTNGQARPFTGPLSVPCTRPPWGHLHLIDLKTDKHAWTRVVGTAQGSAPLGLFSVLPFTIGAQNEGGVLVTRGALIFTGATSDGYFRAYNLFTGHPLWETRLPAGGQAPPMNYATRDGRQFVAIAAGGREGFSSTGDSIVAYTLRASR